MKTEFVFCVIWLLFHLGRSRPISPGESFRINQEVGIQTFEYVPNLLAEEFLLLEVFFIQDSPLPYTVVLCADFQPLDSFEKITKAKYIDYSGWYGFKAYYYLQFSTSDLKNGPPLYIILYANLTLPASSAVYKISLSSLDTPQCPNNCSDNGNCLEGTCTCHKGFGDVDCSIPMISLTGGPSLQIKNNTVAYFYADADEMAQSVLDFQWDQGYPFILTKEGLSSYKTPLPSVYEHGDFFLSNTSTGKFSVQGAIILCVGCQYWYFLVTQSSSHPNDLISLSISWEASSSSQEKSVMLIVIALIGGLVGVSWTLFLLYKCVKCYRRWKERRSQLTPLEKMQQICPQKRFSTLPKSFLDNPCPICLDDFHSDSLTRTLPCHHIYHKTCIDHWFLTNNTCCLCKGDVLKQNPGLTEFNDTQLNESGQENGLQVIPLD